MSSFDAIERKLDTALRDYSESLKDEMVDGAPEWKGVTKGSIRWKYTGNLSTLVGIDRNYVMANQFNVRRIFYPLLYIRGHRESPPVKFTTGEVRVFPSKSASPFISDSLAVEASFSSFYRRA